MIDYVIFASGGNDSVALIQWAAEEPLLNVAVAYSNTGWSSPAWPERIERLKNWVELLGYSFHEIPSEGMENLIRRKSAWPANRPKFCTYELKILPAKNWLNTIDPEGSAIVLVGVRRQESKARANWPEWVESSENHGLRSLWSPLVRMTTEERDSYLVRAGWEVLPHRSRECSPCVNSNRSDFRILGQEDIAKVRVNEEQTGHTMFRPHRFHGAVGIDEVIRWAWSERGQYDSEETGDCNSGMCEL